MLGNAPGELNANAVAPVIGVITLQGCGTGAAGDGVNYTGTTLPPATIADGSCAAGIADDAGGVPGGLGRRSPPICAQAPDCVDGEQCIKRGRKFNAR